MKVLLLDNYDSFTFNLYHYIEQFVNHVEVRRNDEISLEEVANYDKIVISPGPGLPKDAGITCDLIRSYKDSKAILGVCLGYQAIVEVFGGQLKNLPRVLHGKSTICTKINNDPIYTGIPVEFNVGHYHSWVADTSFLPHELLVTATNKDGLIMSLRHKSYSIHGVQFHPESVMTPNGLQMIGNWINL